MTWTNGEGLPWFKDVSEAEDWKDFRYSVMKTHSWISRNETLFKLIPAFRAWRRESMSVEEVNMIEKENNENTNVLPFERPVPSHGGDGGGADWLSELPEGAVFLSRKKSDQTDMLEQWHLTVKWKKGAILYTNTGPDVYKTIDMARFSRQNELVEVLRKQRPEKDYD